MIALLRRIRDWLRPPVREGWGGVLRPKRTDAEIDALVRRAFYKLPDEEEG